MKPESRTFDKRKTAETWAKKREREIDTEIAAGRAPQRRSARRIKLGDAIERYIAVSMREIGKTKAQVLRTIANEYYIANMQCDRIGSPDIVAFVRDLHNRPGLNSASAAGNYLFHLAAIFADARPLWGYPLDAQAMKDAQRTCTRQGYISKTQERTRRPTLEELNKLMTHFQRATEADSRTMPMQSLSPSRSSLPAIRQRFAGLHGKTMNRTPSGFWCAR